MNDRKRMALEAAGYRVGNVSDFLGLSEKVQGEGVPTMA